MSLHEVTPGRAKLRLGDDGRGPIAQVTAENEIHRRGSRENGGETEDYHRAQRAQSGCVEHVEVE
jgi:hypothetical protein